MIRQKFTISRYGWIVYVFYNVLPNDASEIYDTLLEIGCDKFDLDDAWENLTSKELNSGLTYSNFLNRESVIVISRVTSAEQFVKTWRHEIGHLATHIASAYKFNLKNEEVQYIGDDIVGETWWVVRDMICECAL